VRDWDEHYRNSGDADTEPVPLLQRAVRGLPPGRALDLACGTGRHAIFLAQRGWQVTAVDASRVAVDLLRKRAPTVDARAADLEKGEFIIQPATWDLICDFFYLQRDLFPHIRRGVRPAGLFVATMHLFDDSPDPRPRNPDFLLRAGELAAAFADWTVLHYSEIAPQAGRRGVAELIARRNA
jgi:SAM-dependent methyltransferase